MKITRRNFLAASTAMASVTALSACGANSTAASSSQASSSAVESSSSEAPKAVSELNFYIYYADANIPIVDAAVAEMKTIYPDLTINVEHRTDASGDVLKTKAAVGEMPDLIETQGSFMPDFIEAGEFLPLKDTMDETGFLDNYFENSYPQQMYTDGDFYTIRPAAITPFTVFYNTEVFAKFGLSEPKNYDDFKNIITTLKDNGIIPLSLFADQRWPGLQLYDLAVIANGEPLGIGGLEKGERKITEPAYVAAAKQMEEVIDLGLIGAGAFSTNASQAFELIGTDQAGMLVNGAWFFTDAIAEGYPEKISYFSYNPFASAENADAVRYQVSGGTPETGGFSVASTTEDPEFSKKVLLDMVLCYDKAAAQHGKMTALVSPPDAIEPLAEGYKSYIDNYLPKIETTSIYGWGYTNQELLEAFKDQSELLTTGTYSADDFIADLDAIFAELVTT